MWISQASFPQWRLAAINFQHSLTSPCLYILTDCCSSTCRCCLHIPVVVCPCLPLSSIFPPSNARCIARIFCPRGGGVLNLRRLICLNDSVSLFSSSIRHPLNLSQFGSGDTYPIPCIPSLRLWAMPDYSMSFMDCCSGASAIWEGEGRSRLYLTSDVLKGKKTHFKAIRCIRHVALPHIFFICHRQSVGNMQRRILRAFFVFSARQCTRAKKNEIY